MATVQVSSVLYLYEIPAERDSGGSKIGGASATLGGGELRIGRAESPPKIYKSTPLVATFYTKVGPKYCLEAVAGPKEKDKI